MPAIWQTWPRYSSTLSRCSARLIGSRKSTCLLPITMVSTLTPSPTPRLRVIEGIVAFWKGSLPESPPFGVARLLGRLGLAVLVRLDNRRERGHPLVAAEPHDDHALRRAPEPLDLVHRHPDDRSTGGDEHHLVAVAHDPCACERALRLGELDRLHAHAAAALDRIVGDARALAVSVLGDDEEIGVVLRDVDGDDLVPRAQPHAGHAGRVAAHRADFLLVEANRLAELRDHEDVVVA